MKFLTKQLLPIVLMGSGTMKDTTTQLFRTGDTNKFSRDFHDTKGAFDSRTGFKASNSLEKIVLVLRVR
jgi:hypothetical protein